MSCRQWKKSIRGVDDIELGIPRGSVLIYHCAAPESGRAQGLVFLIPDFNDDADGEAFAAMRAHLAERHGLLAVTVEYHCYRSRLKDGAQFRLSDEEFAALNALCTRHVVAMRDRSHLISALRQLPTPYEFEFTVVPASGDFQNFGVMQALDHLAVLNDLMRDKAAGDFDRRNMMALGVGHGGYLAHLISKFAPNALRAVFDADSRTFLPPAYLFGNKAGSEAPYYYYLGNVRVFPLIQTRWQWDQSAAGYTKSRAEIRNAALGSHIGSAHLASRLSGRHCHYRLLLSPLAVPGVAEQKAQQAALLREAGFSVELQQLPAPGENTAPEMQQWNDLMTLFETHYSALPAMSDAGWQSNASYLCGDALYCFDFDEVGCQAMVVPVEPEPKPVRYY